MDFLSVADWIFHLLHLTMIFVNTAFWWWRWTLPLAQIALLLTSLSWFGFGFVFGWGYCFLTDWHWQIKEARGEQDLPLSYIEYVLEGLTHYQFSSEVINLGTGLVYVVSVVGCLWQSLKAKKSPNL